MNETTTASTRRYPTRFLSLCALVNSVSAPVPPPSPLRMYLSLPPPTSLLFPTLLCAQVSSTHPLEGVRICVQSYRPQQRGRRLRI